MHQTKDLNDGYMGSGKYLIHAIKKYGIENFEKEILYVFDNEQEMKDKEAELVNENFVSRKDTYNICVGGQGGWSYVNKERLFYTDAFVLSAKRNIKIAKEAHLFKLKNDINYRKNWTNAQSISNLGKQTFLGKTHCKESKVKIGDASRVHQIGKGNSQYGTFWISNGIEDKKISSIDNIPKGWYKGRGFKKLTLCEECKKNSNKTGDTYKANQKVAEYWYKNLIDSKLSITQFVEVSDYNKSKVSFIRMLKKYIPGFNVVRGKSFNSVLHETQVGIAANH